MMTTVQVGNCCVELSQPLKHRPNVIVITASDGRRAILGDGQDLFTANEYRQIDRQAKLHAETTARPDD